MTNPDIKSYYKDGLWEAIVNNPAFDLGKREFDAFQRLLQNYPFEKNDVIHLGVADGREIEYIINKIKPEKYIAVEWSDKIREKLSETLRSTYKNSGYSPQKGNIESSEDLQKIRSNIDGSVIWFLIGNGSIFSNPAVDRALADAMKSGDMLVTTFEVPNPEMYRSYQIESVKSFLAESGEVISDMALKYWYDDQDSCLKISSNEKTIFASYKPNRRHLIERMARIGCSELKIYEFKNINMIGSIFKKI